jgi:hypothetical protein
MRKQTSAIARLQNLPTIFRGADLTIRFQWTSKTASQYLYLWKKRGLVKGLGGHSDVYANLLTNQNPNWELAVLAAMPSAVIIGIEVLRQAWWTTQVPHRPTVAVDAKQSVFSIDPFEIVPRDSKWFETASNGIQGDLALGLPMLRPAWALADMLHTDGWGKCGLWPDDIDWDEIEERDEADWQTACTAFKMTYPPLHEQAVASR